MNLIFRISHEVARVCSPGRQPGVKGRMEIEPRKGRKFSICRPSGADLSFAYEPRAGAPGLQTVAASQLYSDPYPTSNI